MTRTKNSARTRGRIGFGLLTGLVTLPFAAWAPPALAQSAPGATDPGLDEIVVTAQRRAESLQDVPIAITAVTAESLSRQGIADTRQLSATVPSLDFTQQNNGALVFLRGVGSSNAGMGQESSIAVYVDGVYLATPLASLFSFNSIERVEVLRGPQGTLFGRNAAGGVVQIVTRDPSSDPTADVSLGLANFHTTEASLYASSGLGDKLAADIAIYDRSQRDGWGRNLTLNRDAFGNQQDFAVRSKWLWTPSADTEVRLTADYGRSRTESGVAWHVLPGTRGFDGTTTFPGFYNVTHNFPSGSVVKQGGITLRIDQDFDWARLVSISAYREADGRFTLDQDATAVARVNATVDQHDVTYSQEFQLLSPDDSAIRWIIGAYAHHDEPEFNPLRVQGSAAGSFPFIDINSRQTSTSRAVFGETTLDVTDTTRLTAGIRYTEDERHVVGTRLAAPSTFLANVDNKANFNKITYRLALDQQIAPDVMIYASYNRGFKSGTFNLSSLLDPAVAPEVLDAYEVGLKSEFGRRLRLNGSAYYYDYTNIQTSQVLATGGQRIINAPGAIIQGFDLDFTAVPFSGLTLQGGFAYTHGRYLNFPNAPLFTPTAAGAAQSTVNARGNETVHTPETSYFLTGTYDIPSEIGNFELTGTYSYNDGFFWYPDNVTSQPSYGLLSASLGWTSVNQKYGIRLWGRNLSDEKYYSFVSESGLGFAGSPAPPKTYGVTLSVHF